MRFDELNDDNYLLFAIKYYENPLAATMEDFQNDMRRFKYIKRLFKKYMIQGGELKYHLILNHLIICFNIFDEGAVPLLFYKIDREYWSMLKTFLIFLNRIPEYPKSGLDDLQIDNEVYSILNSIDG